MKPEETMKRFALLGLLLLTSCAPSAQAVQTAIVQTQLAAATVTPILSSTPTHPDLYIVLWQYLKQGNLQPQQYSFPYSIEITGNGTVIYKGKRGTEPKKTRVGELSPEQINELVNVITESRLLDMGKYDWPPIPISEHWLELSITLDGQTVQMTNPAGQCTNIAFRAVCELEQKILATPIVKQWIESP